MAQGVLDHIVVCAGTLEDGVAWIGDRLGVTMADGGEHDRMGTHNRLLSLGKNEYLEVIAVNPAAPAPDHPRLFDLDYFTGEPRLTNWVVRVSDLAAALEQAPAGTGVATPLGRGDFRWLMAVPEDGRYPFGGMSPGMIEWHSDHPASMLPDMGCRLLHLTLAHPAPGLVSRKLAPFLGDERIEIVEGPAPLMTAQIETPGGIRTLT